MINVCEKLALIKLIRIKILKKSIKFKTYEFWLHKFKYEISFNFLIKLFKIHLIRNTFCN